MSLVALTNFTPVKLSIVLFNLIIDGSVVRNNLCPFHGDELGSLSFPKLIVLPGNVM